MSVIIKGKNPRKPHTVRYWQDGRQRERSFATMAEAKAFRTDTDHAARYDVTPVDKRLGLAPFGDACRAYVETLPVNERSRVTMLSSYTAHIAKPLGTRTLADVSRDRDAVEYLLNVTLKTASISVKRRVRQIITGTLDRAVKSGKIPSHRCDGITITETARDGESEDYFDASLFPTFKQIGILAESLGVTVWIMRACGLRVQEALAVEKRDFIPVIDNGQTHMMLRVCRQATRDGKNAVACKKRKSFKDARMVPVPAYLWDMVRDMPDGILCPGNGRAYQTYGSVLSRWNTARKRAGIGPAVTPHWLRHQFATDTLSAGESVTNVAKWMGHRDSSVTERVYHSVLRSAASRAAQVLQAAYDAEMAA